VRLLPAGAGFNCVVVIAHLTASGHCSLRLICETIDRFLLSKRSSIAAIPNNKSNICLSY
jgi:hypothetical protein